MTILMSPDRVDWVIRNHRWLILSGVALCAVGCRFETFGLVTGAFLIPLGASGGSLGAWRREQGLWMLACAFLALFLPLYAIFEHRAFAGGFRDSHLSPWQMMDFVVATAVLFFQVRFYVTVARSNWLVSRQRKAKG